PCPRSPPHCPPLFPYTTLFRSLSVIELAGVVAELELGQVAVKMLFRYRVIDAVQPTLDDRKEPFNAIGGYVAPRVLLDAVIDRLDRKSTRLNSSHVSISYAVFC